MFSKFLSFRATLDFVDFCVLASPGDRFEASERNRDVSRASTARKMIPDAFRTIRMAAVLARAFSPKLVFGNKNGERMGGERDKRKRRKEGRERRKEKRRQQTAPQHGPSVARTKRALLFG